MYRIELTQRSVQDSCGDLNLAQTIILYQEDQKLLEIDDWRGDWGEVSFWSELTRWCESDFSEERSLSLDSTWKFFYQEENNQIKVEMCNGSDEQKITLYLSAAGFEYAVIVANEILSS